ncbi:MAG: TIGR00159 family protein [Chloroflexi bacterium]|jgi:diadenylate cyclase|nr:TIGR00159 family protein [Chloroflexota bacterium]
MDYILFIFERLDWFGVVDILLVTAVFFIILLLLRDTQAIVLLRGGLILIAILGILTSLKVLPAFSWLVGNTLPGLLLAIPVIFAPEIRRALERLGHTGSLVTANLGENGNTIDELANAVTRLSDRKHGALIVLQRSDNLQEYVQTGVPLGAIATAELLLQVFYPNTPLHDGAVIIRANTALAASCVMPLSTSGSLITTPERKMGLRHRAALGTSEVSDAVSVVVSEETGTISITHRGRMISNLTTERLKTILHTFFQPPKPKNFFQATLERVFPELSSSRWEGRP